MKSEMSPFLEVSTILSCLDSIPEKSLCVIRYQN